MLRATRFVLACCLVVGLAGCAGVGSTPTATDTQTPPSATPSATPTATATATATPDPVATPGSDYEMATVTINDENGTQVATVEAWVADDFEKLYTGLSETEALEPGQGMLFIHGQEADHAYVMRDMAFPLDMIFIAENGTITTIHHAPVESDDDLTRYSGRSKYVLEVPYGYTNETGIEVGDRVEIDR